MTRQQRRHAERQSVKKAPVPPKRPGRWSRWLVVNKVTGTELADAREALMSGPRAQQPTWRAVRKMIARFRNGELPGDFGWSPWRSAKRVA